MNKNVTTVLSALILLSFSTGCGSRLSPTLPTNNQISSFNTNVSPAETAQLNKINTSIDFSTGTKSSSNNTNVQFHIDGPNAFPVVERKIMEAKKSVYVETFIFENDVTGKRFADALVRKAKEGLDVRFIYDYIGTTNIKWVKYMVQNGVKVQTYNQGVKTKRGVNITHRKIFLVDGDWGMTGGMNIGDEYSTGQWHDLMVSFEGQAVKDTMKEFFVDWKLAGGNIAPEMQQNFSKPIALNENSKMFNLRVAVTSPKEVTKRESIKRMFFSAIDTAQKNIYIAMPYFVDDEIIERLIVAQKRGVEVKAIIPYETDNKVINKVHILSTNQLIEAGVTVYKGNSRNKRFNHSKTISVDNIWTTIGSANADYRSFNISQELNLAISDPQFTKDFNRKFFEMHIRNSDVAKFVKIPWYKKPFYNILEALDNLL